jgi:hypothetical protein
VKGNGIESGEPVIVKGLIADIKRHLEIDMYLGRVRQSTTRPIELKRSP